jgi:hypothetical protein
MYIPHEITEGLSKIALEIWTDCVNAGQPFQVALLAVYISGLQHGSSLSPPHHTGVRDE